MSFKIVPNTDSVDIRQKCLGMCVSRSSIPKDVMDHIHTDRGLHIQIRHNRDAQAFEQANQVSRLIAVAPELLSQLEYVVLVLKAINGTVKTDALIKECEAVIAKAKGQKL